MFSKILSIGIVAGAIFLFGNFAFVWAQNSTATADTYSKSLELWVGLIIAVAALGKTFVDRFHVGGRVGQVLTVVQDQGNEILKNKETIKQGMETVYTMLPEESQKIIDKPLVRVNALNNDVEKMTGKINVINTLVDKFGKPVPTA